MKIYYKATTPEHIKFQRITMGWLSIAALYSFNIDLVLLFFGITVLGLITGSEYSLTTLFYKLVKTLFKFDMVKVTEHHLRYYQINITMDLIDNLLRIMATSTVIALYYSGFEEASWMVMCFLSIFMMLSAYFGFCLSALTYVAMQNVTHMFSKAPAESNLAMDPNNTKHRNNNCTLAKRCFTPYKRCDSCHIDITACLGTKFNSLMLIIGTLMATFLFVDNPIFVRVNILIIMGLLFWFGYQVNYSMDDLTDSNDANVNLNRKLKDYNETLEEEVKRRTAEIERLATYDMLTEIFNRFSFEKILLETYNKVQDNGLYHLAFIDLDKFKLVNDTAGHLAGDELLVKFAKLITEATRTNGTVGRLGGDEFAIVFDGVSIDVAQEICQNICDKTKGLNFTYYGERFDIGASIGLTTINTTMQDIKAVVYHADEACYKAKKAGRGQVCLSS